MFFDTIQTLQAVVLYHKKDAHLTILTNHYPLRSGIISFAKELLIFMVVFGMIFFIIPADSLLMCGPDWLRVGYFIVPIGLSLLSATKDYYLDKNAKLVRLDNGDLRRCSKFIGHIEEELPEKQIRLYKKRQMRWQERLNVTNLTVFALGHDDAAIVIRSVPVDDVEAFIKNKEQLDEN